VAGSALASPPGSADALSVSVTFIRVLELPCQDSFAAAMQLLAVKTAELQRSSLGAAPSGVLRVEVAVPSGATALQWLAAQAHAGGQSREGAVAEPCVYFSPRVAPSPASDTVSSDIVAGPSPPRLT